MKYLEQRNEIDLKLAAGSVQMHADRSLMTITAVNNSHLRV